MNQRERRRLARFRAGLILETVVENGWLPPDLVEKYGEDEVHMIATEISDIATKLIKNS